MKIKLPRPNLSDDVKRSLRSIVGAMGDAFGLIENYLARTPRREIVVMSVALADAPFIVPHSLNATPTFVSGSGSVNAHVYWTPADKSEWSKSIVKVRYPSTGLVTVRIEA